MRPAQLVSVYLNEPITPAGAVGSGSFSQPVTSASSVTLQADGTPVTGCRLYTIGRQYDKLGVVVIAGFYVSVGVGIGTATFNAILPAQTSVPATAFSVFAIENPGSALCPCDIVLTTGGNITVSGNAPAAGTFFFQLTIPLALP